MADRHEDERGAIQDLHPTLNKVMAELGPVDAITHIRTRKGSIRGNHVHYETTQWTWVLSGRLLVATSSMKGREFTRVIHEQVLLPGMMTCEHPGVAHAWHALEDTDVLVFTKGPRSGENYESDTHREGIHLL